MIGSCKQMDLFLARYEPIISKWGKCSLCMEAPSKTGRVFVHRHLTIGKENGVYFGNFKTDPKIYRGNCIEDVLDKMGLILLVEK